MVVILVTIACLLLLSRSPQASEVATPSPVAVSTPESGAVSATDSRVPAKIVFKAEEPVKGFSDCSQYGFKGTVKAGNETRLTGVQIVVWEEQAGLLALDNPNSEGNYLIIFDGPPVARTLWLQVYENDVPVSQPVLSEIQFDCQTGFQVYQIDWQQLEGDE